MERSRTTGLPAASNDVPFGQEPPEPLSVVARVKLAASKLTSSRPGPAAPGRDDRAAPPGRCRRRGSPPASAPRLQAESWIEHRGRLARSLAELERGLERAERAVLPAGTVLTLRLGCAVEPEHEAEALALLQEIRVGLRGAPRSLLRGVPRTGRLWLGASRSRGLGRLQLVEGTDGSSASGWAPGRSCWPPCAGGYRPGPRWTSGIRGRRCR